VPEEQLAAVLDAARWAPSPHNAEPWRFVVLREPEPKERLAVAMGRRWQTDLAADGVAQDAIDTEIAKSRARITEAPIVILACLCDDGLDQYPDSHRQQAELLMAAHSLGAAVQNMMLAAHARGLATGWMCAPLFCPEVVREELDLPGEFFPQGLITVGYPTAWPKARARRPMPELVIER
jgi:F420 biosynthesis protein FbiB-like protein